MVRFEKQTHKQVATKGSVKGLTLPAPHLTKGGIWLIVRHLGLPIMSALLALDIALFFVFKYVFNSCYGILCLL